MKYQLKKSLLPQEDYYTVVERIFATRGIAPQDIEHYIKTTDEDILNPLLLDNIDDGIKMLARHIANNDNILVQVDSDCDGFTSAAVFINYLNRIFPGFVQNHIYYRLQTGKQHGIVEEVIPTLIQKRCALLVCPDSASNDYEQHALLKQKGIDVLILDHHEADYVSKDACVINNQLCDYPTKSLSGVGIVYKFCKRFDELLGYDFADEFIDMVSLGLTGDMMSVKDFETKHLIHKGFTQIKNPFLKEMVRLQSYSINRAGGLCPFALSFYIVPQINGTIRMGTADDKLLLFESMLDFKGLEHIPSTKRGCKGQFETRAAQACRNCNNVKNHQTKARDESLAIIESIIEDNNLLDNRVLAIKLDPDIHKVNRNLTGLIANQIMAKYQHPTLLLVKCVSPEGEITWEGSGRGYDAGSFNNFREFLIESEYATLAQGHPNAFGAVIPDENFKHFIKYSNKVLEDINFTPCAKVDFIWSPNDFTANDIINIANLTPYWGQEFEEPKIAVENIQITKHNITLMSKDKNPTLKILLPNGVSIIKFKSSIEEYEELTDISDTGSITINLIGTCAMNEWNGRIDAQIKVDDYEIVGKKLYYF